MLNCILKKLRLEKGYTLKYLGQYLGLTYQAYSYYEKGIREPSIDTLKKLSVLYEVPVDYLVGNIDAKDYYDKRLAGRTSEKKQEKSSGKPLNTLGDYEQNIRFLKDKPELLAIYMESLEKQTLGLLSHNTKELSQEDLEELLRFAVRLRKMNEQ